ncbi:MAG: Prophage integrase IntA [Marinobacterium sp. xm-d-530]|nr:MAG: Prophage integrase IntA [Marinobacterium sp. xm-d-530]
MPLTDRQIKAAKPLEKDYKLSDEKGLYLLVKKNGSKLFNLKYRFLGKEKKLSIGKYPDVSLQQARRTRDEARTYLTQGVDPSAHKQAQRAAQLLAAENSFQTIAEEWLITQMSDRTEAYRNKVRRSLEKNLYPRIGALPVSEITAPALLAALRAIEERGVIDTAHRVKQVAGQVIRYAIATGRAERDPTPDLRGALKPKTTKHLASITEPQAVGRLLMAIDAFNGTPIVKAALQLSPMFFCRPGELRHLKWTDINHEEHRIEIIAEKTKTPHIIPLSTQALGILRDLYQLTGRSQYIFPSARGASRCMSENALRVALRGMGYDNNTMTPHGFRAMARTLLDEVLGFRVEWIEQQLAHAVKDANGRAYNRTKHLKQRADMMQKWADYLDQLRASAKAGNVISASFGVR